MTAAVALAAGQAFRTCHTESAKRRHPVFPGRTALLLSGGGNLSFFHLGVIKVLLEANLLPRVLSGASAGSVMAGLIGTRHDDDLAAIHVDELEFIGFSDRKPEAGYTSERVEASIANVIPDVTFAEAMEISGRAINIALAHPNGGGVICGPRSTPDVLVRDAIRASCAVPYFFPPVVVRERRMGRVTAFNAGQGWVDGSLFADIPANFIRREYAVEHTIVSLVNPAVRPFVSDAKGGSVVHCLFKAAARGAVLGCAKLGKFSAVGAPKARSLFNTAYRVINQPYGGDLVLTPSRRFAISGLMDHPSSEMIRTLSADGAVRTRDRLDTIREMMTGPRRAQTTKSVFPARMPPVLSSYRVA